MRLGHHVRKLLWFRVRNGEDSLACAIVEALNVYSIIDICESSTRQSLLRFVGKSLKSLPGFRVWATCRVRTPSSLSALQYRRSHLSYFR